MDKTAVYFKTFFAFFIWSLLGPILNKSSLTSFQNIFLFTVLGAIWLVFILFLKKELFLLKKVKFTPLFLLFALVSGVAGVMWLKSLTLIPIAIALFLFSSIPIIALLMEITIFKEKVRFLHLIAIGVGITGIAILLSKGLVIKEENFSIMASLLVLIAAFLFAVQGFLIKKLEKSSRFEIIILTVMLSQALISASFAFQSPWNFDYHSVALTLFLSIFSSVVAWYFYIDALKILRVSTVRLIGYIEPLLGSIWGIIFLSQSLLPVTILGGFFILLASYIAVKSGE